MSFIGSTPEDISMAISARTKARRLALNLTQKGLAIRSGVSFGTLKKFERTGQIALPSFIRLAIALRDEAALEGLMSPAIFETLDDVLKTPKKPQRGRIT